MLRRAPLTLFLTLFAASLAFLVAVPLGALAAWRTGRAIDTSLAFSLFAIYSIPTFFLALVAKNGIGVAPFGGIDAGPDGGLGPFLPRLVLPTVVLAAGSLAALSRFQRASMLEVVGLDYVRTAHAKGVPGLRVLIVHVLRTALMPTVTLLGLQFPALLGGAFVVEEVFALPGIGWETVRAVEAHDSTWLITVSLVAAIGVTIALIASDVAYGLLDPRVRESIGRPGVLR